MEHRFLWLAGACIGLTGLWGCGPGLPAREPAEEKVWFVGAAPESPAAPERPAAPESPAASSPVPRGAAPSEPAIAKTPAAPAAQAAPAAEATPPAQAAPAVKEKLPKPEPGRTALSYKVLGDRTGCDTEEDLRLWVQDALGSDPFVPTGPPPPRRRRS